MQNTSDASTDTSRLPGRLLIDIDKKIQEERQSMGGHDSRPWKEFLVKETVGNMVRYFEVEEQQALADLREYLRRPEASEMPSVQALEELLFMQRALLIETTTT